MNRCDNTLYTGDIAKYITHLIYFHEANNPRLLTMMKATEPEAWDIIDQVHDALIEHDGLKEREEQGYCTDQWARWQQGMSQTYAEALITIRPSLRLGVIGTNEKYNEYEAWIPQQFFAHDDEYAYDSAGRHPLPYHGVDGDMDHVELDADLEAWGTAASEEGSNALDLVDAVRHSVRNGILIGTYKRKTEDVASVLALLDGTEEAALSVITGFSPAELKALGGLTSPTT